MAIAWGEFEDMAVHYLRELAKREAELPILFCSKLGLTYGVGKNSEFADMVTKSDNGMYRSVCAASPDEFMGLLLARFMDFTEEEEDAVEKKDISTGELIGGEPTSVDAGRDKSEKGGRGGDNGSREEEDNNRTVH